MADYDINYDDQRFKEVESDKKAAISENEKLYSGMIKDSDGYYQAQIDAAKEWEKKQTQLLLNLRQRLSRDKAGKLYYQARI